MPSKLGSVFRNQLFCNVVRDSNTSYNVKLVCNLEGNKVGVLFHKSPESLVMSL